MDLVEYLQDGSSTDGPRDHRYDEQHNEDDKQDLRYTGGCSGDAAKAEYTGDTCNDKKFKRHAK